MKDRKAGFSDTENTAEGLKRVLTVKDLTLMGIAAVIGAGIFQPLEMQPFRADQGLVFYLSSLQLPAVSRLYVMQNLLQEYLLPAVPIPMPMLLLVNLLPGSLAGTF